jgi:DNA-binding transcriptional LysR family regulator
MQLELRHLRSFLAVAEELSFTRAAERLHIAQPALSAQIRQLETQLGCDLFTRTTRKVELTSHGELLLPDASEIVRLADEAAAKLAAAARGERGVLRVGFVGHGAGEAGTEILRRFAAEFPNVLPDLVESPTLEETQRQLRDDETDVGFVWLPLLYPELSSLPIHTERKLLAIREESALAEKAQLLPPDLYEQPIVAPWEHMPPEMLEFWLGPFRPHGRLRDDPDAKGIDECFSFVTRGVAAFCVPESVERFYVRPGVVFRPISNVAPAEIHLAWRRESRNRAVPRFVEVARAVIAARVDDPATI